MNVINNSFRNKPQSLVNFGGKNPIGSGDFFLLSILFWMLFRGFFGFFFILFTHLLYFLITHKAVCWQNQTDRAAWINKIFSKWIRWKIGKQITSWVFFLFCFRFFIHDRQGRWSRLLERYTSLYAVCAKINLSWRYVVCFCRVFALGRRLKFN